METQDSDSVPPAGTPDQDAPRNPIDPVDMALRHTYGFGLPPARAEQPVTKPPAENNTANTSLDIRSAMFEDAAAIVMFGQPLVVRKEPEEIGKENATGHDTSAEELTLNVLQPEPEPEPTAIPIPVPVPVNQEAIQVDREKAKRFYEQLEEMSRKINVNEDALNLQAIKGLEAFREIDGEIQSLALEYSKEDFILQDHHILSLEEISERLATKLEEKNGWNQDMHQSNVAAVGLAIGTEIENRVAQISGLAPTTEPVSPEPLTQPPPPPTPPAIPPVFVSPLPETPVQTEVVKQETLIDKLNNRLKQSNSEREIFEENVKDLIDYVKTLDLPKGASIKTLDATMENGKLRLKGEINALKADSSFGVILENDQTQGVKVLGKPEINLPWHLRLLKGSLEKYLSNLNQVITDQINRQVDPGWNVVNFIISGDNKITFDFRKKQS